MEDYIFQLKQVFETYGLWFIFPLLLLENFPFIGFFTPAMTVLLLAGFLLADNTIDLFLVIIISYSAMLVGDNLWFFFGRKSQGKWKWLNRVTKRSNKALDVIKQQRLGLLLFFQFAPYYRMFLPYAFGISNYPLKRWLFINLIGSCIFVLTFVLAGYFASQYISDFQGIQLLSKNMNTIIIIVVAIYTLFLIRKIVLLQRKKSKNE